MKIITDLISFINLAEHNRKYSSNTAFGYKAALKRFAEVLNEDEGNSLQLVEDHFPQIVNSFYNKHGGEVTAASMDVYKKRVKKVIQDYKKWGTNLADWKDWVVISPARRNKVEKNAVPQTGSQIPKTNSSAISNVETSSIGNGTEDFPRQMLSTRFEIPLRPGITAFISTPSDLTRSEATKIKKYIDYLIEISKDE